MAWRDLRAPVRAPFEPVPPDGALAALCVLASGSAGNCSLLRVRDEAGRWVRTCLIDAGLSPRRTTALLAERGVALRDVTDIILTHLDTDHFHGGWRRHRECHATLRLHHRHVARAQRQDGLLRRNDPFDGPVRLGPLECDPVLLSHDDLGVAAFRFRLDNGATLGLATDVGRVTDDLVNHLAGVDVLAIESNYCPVMQAQSSRPEALKRRITGGSGHLSNEQCARAVARIQPGSDVVLLHLSRQCNTPALAAQHHDGAPYRLTLSSQSEPTGWIWITPGERRSATLADRVPQSLFHGVAAG